MDCMWRWTEQICAMLKESAAAERPGRLLVSDGAFYQASNATKSSCTVHCGLSQQSLHAGLGSHLVWQPEAGTGFHYGGAKLEP